jgi:hypothetical protein
LDLKTEGRTSRDTILLCKLAHSFFIFIVNFEQTDRVPGI